MSSSYAGGGANGDFFGPQLAATVKKVAKQIAKKPTYAELSTKLAKVRSELKQLNAAIKEAKTHAIAGTIALNGLFQWVPYLNKYVIYNDLIKEQKAHLASEASILEAMRFVNISNAQNSAPSSSANKPGKDTKTPPKSDPKIGPLEYNVPAVKEAYFLPNQSLANSTDENWSGKGAVDKFDAYLYSGNRPSAVTDAVKLWTSADPGNGSKGMIQTWLPDTKVASTNDGMSMAGFKKQKFGFQFLYNPGTISMSYGGMLEVDPMYVMSGNDEFAPAAAYGSSTDSKISFEILVNRMFDMPYLKAGGKLKSGTASDFWSGKVPTTKDLKGIYDKGTMYDVEYLIKAITGLELKTELRGLTSDIGFIGAIPVELHLGNKMRYVASIDSINVDHRIFDWRMVPLFSTISITASRVPDIKVTAVDGAGGAGGGGTSASKVIAVEGGYRIPGVPGKMIQ